MFNNKLINNDELLKSSSAIAIIGLSFRFPGDQQNEQDFWNALKEGKDFIGEIPHERWATNELQHDKRSEAGRSVTFAAGVLSRIEEFDAGFFGISPREAAWLDPQQRLLLELAWESMENANIKPSSLAGSDCAVYVGISGLDYGTRGLDDLASLSSHIMTGNTLSIAANRLSYIFDLHGPSLAIDTACSSSLVALHQACKALQSGEAKTALVGGVNMLLHPYPFVGFTKASMLSADGRCKTFDASGNGYVRSEGGAVLIIKPLDKAIADGDEIQGVILATGTNTDGSRKTGITIPSQEGQIELMQNVLAKAGLLADDIDFIEAHGTGTIVGDPIETAAIGEVYGKNRKEPLLIGSIKANLGHLEPASGMAGMVKAILSLKNRALTPQIHFTKLNPYIDFSKLNLKPVTQYTQFSNKNKKPLIAGVNSFGFGGSNAHVLLQEYRKDEHKNTTFVPEFLPPLFLSARSDAALMAMAANYVEFLSGKTTQEYYDIAYTAAHRRERMEKSLALVAKTADQAIESLSIYAKGERVENIFVEDTSEQKGGVAFVYSGNGAQWIGMGRRLLAESERFAEILRDLDVKIQSVVGFSLLEELFAEDALSHIDDTVVAQPLLFAIQVGVTLLLQEQGVQPLAVCGHSVGEVAAAWASGALDLQSAIRVIVARSHAQGETRGTGRMAVVEVSSDAMQKIMTELGGAINITIAGVNSPSNITLSGSLTDLKHIQKYCKTNGILFRLLDLDYAFHSPYMDPIEEILSQSLVGLEPLQNDKIAFVSTVTGNILDGKMLDASYWWHNVREQVRFADAIKNLADFGCRVFIEIGPHAILQRYISDSLSASEIKGRVLPTLRKDSDGLDRIVDTSVRAHLLMQTLNLDRYFPKPARLVRIPNYPWQKERHWHPKTSESLLSIQRYRIHPLLGWQVPESQWSWENTIDPYIVPWLADHKVGGAVVFPGAAYAEMALAAAREWQGTERFLFEELDIVSPMVFNEEHARTLRLDLFVRDGSFQIKSRQRLSTDEWTLHAVGRILETGKYLPSSQIEPVLSIANSVNHQSHYELTTALGLDYGPAFRGFFKASVLEETIEAEIRVVDDLAQDGYIIHPAITDICYQSIVNFYRDQIKAGHGVALLPVKVGRLESYKNAKIVKFRARLNRRSARSVLADFELFDEDENMVASIYGCRFRAAPLGRNKKEKITNWHIHARLHPHPRDNSQNLEFPSSSKIFEQVALAMQNIEQKRHAWFFEALPLFEALVVSFAFDAFKKISQTEDILFRLANSSDPYMLWLLELLRQNGLLYTKDGHLVLMHESDLPSPEEIWLTLMREHSDCLPQLILLGRIGRQLPQLLENTINRNEFLDSLSHSPTAEMLYDNDPAYLGIGYAIENILQTLANDFVAHRRLRVLEISCGSSQLPYALLDILPQERLEYVLALSDDTLRGRQQAEFANFTNFTAATFNLSTWSVEAEEALPESFDIVILRHVLHYASNFTNALTHVQNLLTPGGVLLVAERHPDASADFMAGLDPKWWHSKGDNNSFVSSLLTPLAWETMLKSEGFGDVVSFHEPVAEELASGSYLMFAKRLHQSDIQASYKEESWLFLVDEASIMAAQKLRVELESLAQHIEVAHELPKNFAQFNHVVHMRGWSIDPQQTQPLLNSLLEDVQNISADTSKMQHLWIVTRGGALTSELPTSCCVNPAQTALWGFGRVVMNEIPELECTLIDLACDLDANDTISRLTNEFLYPDGLNEIVLTDHKIRSILVMSEKEIETVHTQEEQRFRLDFHVPGQLRNLTWLSQKEKVLCEDEVEVRVEATGLNFRDVMYLMGLLPDDAVENGFAGASLGLEFSGIVAKVGSGVRDFKEGDRVMGFGSSCFSSHVITNTDALTLMPKGWSFEAAATVPTVFFTVYYALKYLADIQPNESVLIHGGAGGVGIAAIQLAKHLGAKVFVTAGTEEKRDFVYLLGADYVFDSRSLSFADDILVATQGKGVDVILNSLAGEAIRRNLSILKPFGRFLELGKRDFFENTPIGLRPFRNNISYFGIDADQLLTGRPQLASRMFREVMSLFQEGALVPLPYRVFSAKRVVDAFRFMQQSRHIGKVIVSLSDAKPSVEKQIQTSKELHFAKETTWLITGGLSGFGLESARWLIEHGVTHFALVGRTAVDTDAIREIVAQLHSQGVSVKAFSCDITNKDAVNQLIEKIRQTMPPLKGIIHAAAVYEDTFLHNLDATKMQKVVAPKLQGALHLHNATLDIEIDYFIFYSSITVAIGNPSQANYVSANAALEGLAKMRRSMGLPATCISWGPIGNAGYLARNDAVLDSLSQRLGKAPLDYREALEQLQHTLPDDAVLANFDWNVLSRVLPSSQSSRFSLLNRNLKNTGLSEEDMDFRAMIANKKPYEVTAIVQQMVAHEVAQILAISSDRIELSRSLHDVGLDSLMAVELALGLEQRIGVQLPVMMLNESPTVEKITNIIVQRLLGNSEAEKETGGTIDMMVQELAKKHGESISDEDAKNITDGALHMTNRDFGSQI